MKKGALGEVAGVVGRAGVAANEPIDERLVAGEQLAESLRIALEKRAAERVVAGQRFARRRGDELEEALGGGHDW